MATVVGPPFIDPNTDDDDVTTPHFADTVHLTARELEVARLAADRLTDS